MNNIHIWKGSDPKRKFSSLVRQAQKEGPQIIIYEKMKPFVFLPIEDYRKLNYQLTLRGKKVRHREPAAGRCGDPGPGSLRREYPPRNDNRVTSVTS